MLKLLFQLAFLAFSVVALVHAAPKDETELLGEDIVTPLLKLVATVDGKSYFQDFQDASARRSWSDAKAYCISLGMKLASITTTAQLNALNGAYSSEFQHDFWTAGRDSLTPSQFVWDGSGISVSRVTIPYSAYTSSQTCVAYNSNANGQSHLVFNKCTQNYGVLCET